MTAATTSTPVHHGSSTATAMATATVAVAVMVKVVLGAREEEVEDGRRRCVAVRVQMMVGA